MADAARFGVNAGYTVTPSGQPRCGCGTRDNWFVTARKCNYSAFNGYRYTPSDYSEVTCVASEGGCGAVWRTKAKYVDTLPGARRGTR